jgi:hypothetical protein
MHNIAACSSAKNNSPNALGTWEALRQLLVKPGGGGRKCAKCSWKVKCYMCLLVTSWRFVGYVKRRIIFFTLNFFLNDGSNEMWEEAVIGLSFCYDAVSYAEIMCWTVCKWLIVRDGGGVGSYYDGVSAADIMLRRMLQGRVNVVSGLAAMQPCPFSGSCPVK